MAKSAVIYRMVTPDHLCPWGIKAKDLLQRSGYQVEDHHLTSKKANDAYKKENGYDETPQIFINGKHVGGYDALRKRLGKGADPKEGETYLPVIVVFAVALGMALTTSWAASAALPIMRVLELFVAFSMCILGILKLRDLQGFATGFVQYDLVAQRYVPYAYVYAFIETIGGVLMIANLVTWVIAPVVLVASTIGAVSIIKAVYIEKRSLKCACVGGGSEVPLGFVSLAENLIMIAMAIWMMAHRS
jgi:glutaredoxin/uncharacterized membrane protein YphA (DoxX/SURF4 family)